MDYLTSFIIGINCGLLLCIFLKFPSFKKEAAGSEHFGNLATRDDIKKLEGNIEEMKSMYRNNTNLADAEKEFYDENGIE